MYRITTQLVLLALYSAGTLTECYDELGNRYQLPVYCLAPPVNLISERSDDDPSDSSEPPAAPKKEFQLKVRRWCFSSFAVLCYMCLLNG